MAGVTLIDADAGSSPPSRSSRSILSRTGLVVWPSTAAWRAPARGGGVWTAGVLEFAERDDAKEHRNKDQRYDEDGL